MRGRQWNAFYDCDGEPWAVFLWGHNHDLRTLKSLACKEEIRLATYCEEDAPHFSGNLNIGRWWIRDEGEDADDPDHSWQFCSASAEGATPITGAKFQ